MKRVGVRSLTHNILRVRGACWNFRMGTRTRDKWVNYSHKPTHETTSWLVHNWITFGAWISHEHTQIHKTHHGPNLGEPTTFPLIVFSMLGH
jgi:hypothetical protein